MPQKQKSSKYVDLSHPIEDGMITYPGLPGPIISDYWSHAHSRQFYGEGTEFHIGQIEMVANTGTYIDSPFHRYPLGMDLSELPLSSLADLEGIVVQAVDRSQRAIDETAFQGLEVAGKAVLVHTGWDAHWGSQRYFTGHPFLTRRAAQHLVASGAALVGIDSLNIDNTDDPYRPVHTLLLKAGIPIVEHLCGLEQLPETGFRFFAVPVRVKGMGSFPVRTFGIIGKS
jgi:arylformamidase